MQQTTSEYESPLVQAIKARPRNAHLFRVSEFLGLPGPEVHHIKVRVATKQEEETAIVAAAEHVQRIAGHSEAKNDPDLLGAAKTCYILHTVCREASDEDVGGAFLGPDWMREHFTTDHLACLLNLYNEVRKKEGPQPKDLSDETVEARLRLCAAAVEDDEAIPQWVLADCNRETLSELVVVAAVKLDVARKEADAANKFAEEQREFTEEIRHDIDRMRALFPGESNKSLYDLVVRMMKASGAHVPEGPTEPDGQTT